MPTYRCPSAQFPRTPFSKKFAELTLRDNLTMDRDAGICEQDTGDSGLTGLKFSAGLLVALGCLWGLYAIFGVVIAGTAAIHMWEQSWRSSVNGRMLLAGCGSAVISSALAWLCLKAGKALREARRWGAYVAMAFGLLLLLFPVLFIYDLHHPERQSVDEGYGIVLIPFMVLVGLWWCVYLNLPHVRAHLRRTLVR